MWQPVLLCFSLCSQNLTIIRGKYVTSLLEENSATDVLFRLASEVGPSLTAQASGKLGIIFVE